MSPAARACRDFANNCGCNPYRDGSDNCREYQQEFYRLLNKQSEDLRKKYKVGVKND